MLMYANNIVVMREDSEELQKMLDLVAQHGKEFGLKFRGEYEKCR